MLNSIPYDHPSLVLGNIVDTKVLGILKKISGAGNAIDASQSKMNSLMTMKRNIAMTIGELLDMNVDVSALQEKLSSLDQNIAQAAGEYIDARLQNETSIQQLREQLAQLELTETPQSPIDFQSSDIIQKPLFSESLKLDAQYFSFEQNTQQDILSNIESFIKEATSSLGGKSSDISKQATAQVVQQQQHHSVAGTLIIVASCTHRQVAMIEPCILDPEKAISAWNQIYPQELIDTTQPENLHTNVNTGSNSTNDASLAIITGATFGSSFVGMVHLINSEKNSSGPSTQVMDQLSDKLRLGGWLENLSGGVGVNESIMSDVKKLLSTQEITSHVTMVSMGAVPSISSNKIKMGVKQLASPDKEQISNLLTNSSGPTTVDSEANEAVAKNRAVTINNMRLKSLMQGLQTIDERQNSLMDINSLMAAFENYLTEVKGANGIVGVPIDFHLRKYNKSQLLDLWTSKYGLTSDSNDQTSNSTKTN